MKLLEDLRFVTLVAVSMVILNLLIISSVILWFKFSLMYENAFARLL